MKQEGTTLNMVWWIPSAFWEETLKEQMTGPQRKEFLSVLEEYSVFAVVNADTGVFGGMTPKPRAEIEANTELRVGGSVLPVLQMDQLGADAKNFFTMMKPMMSQMLGQMGEGMEFLVYPNKRDGELIIDPLKEGSFTYKSFDDVFHWRLPLGSLLPPRYDAASGEAFPGNYVFNPYTGAKLIDQETKDQLAKEKLEKEKKAKETE